jgi:hypothetical protein
MATPFSMPRRPALRNAGPSCQTGKDPVEGPIADFLTLGRPYGDDADHMPPVSTALRGLRRPSASKRHQYSREEGP